MPYRPADRRRRQDPGRLPQAVDGRSRSRRTARTREAAAQIVNCLLNEPEGIMAHRRRARRAGQRAPRPKMLLDGGKIDPTLIAANEIMRRRRRPGRLALQREPGECADGLPRHHRGLRLRPDRRGRRPPTRSSTASTTSPPASEPVPRGGPPARRHPNRRIADALPALAIGLSARTPRHASPCASPRPARASPCPSRAPGRCGADGRTGARAAAPATPCCAFDDLAPRHRLRASTSTAPPPATSAPPPAPAWSISPASVPARTPTTTPGAIAAAIAATPPGGTAVRPAGSLAHRTDLPALADLTLHLAEGADARRRRRPRPLPDPAGPPPRRPHARKLGRACPPPATPPSITAIDARNVAITGSGTLDGGGDRGDWWTWPKETRDGARRARTLLPHRLRGRDPRRRHGPQLALLDGASRSIAGCVVASALTIESHPDSPNTDGLNPECCEDVTHRGRAASRSATTASRSRPASAATTAPTTTSPRPAA